MTINVTTTDYLLPTGQTLTSVDLPAINAQVSEDSFATVTIAGRVAVTASPQTLPPGQVSTDLGGFYTNLTPSFYGGKVVINAGGVLDVDVTGSRHPASGIADLAGQQVLNFGQVRVVADLYAVGILVATQSSPGGPSQIENIGTVEVRSNQSNAIGILLMNGAGGGNSGVVHAWGATRAVGLQLQQISSFTNSGEVVAHDTSGGVNSVGAFVSFLSAQTVSFTNSGHIEGVTAITINSNLFSAGAVANIQNSGQLIGNVNISGAAAILTNTGLISGAISLTANNDVYDGRAGTETGLVSGLDGTDTMIGGAGFDNFQGNQGNDSLSGGAGDDIVVGGKDNDVQLGGGGVDVVWGNLGNDTLDGGDGNDQVRGGQGDDSVSGGAGDDFVSGDRGNDTISGGTGADLFHGSQDAGLDRVLDFSVAQGDRVFLDPGTTFTVSQVGADTVIDMGSGNQMILAGVQMLTLPAGWIFGA